MRHRADTILRTLALCGCAIVGGCSDLGEPIEYLGVQNYRNLRYAATERQVLDFTCGGAALATILKYYWNQPSSEAQVLSVLNARYPDPEQWKAKIKDGFSFDDLEFAAKAYGFKAQGARIAAEDLSAISGPVIVHLDKGTFEHFSVLRKVHKDLVYLSDPILGLTSIPFDRFKKEYSGAALAVWKEGVPLPNASPLGVVRSGVAASRTLGTVMEIPPALPPQVPTLR